MFNGIIFNQGIVKKITKSSKGIDLFLKSSLNIKKKDIGSFRPALGIEVKYYNKIIGKKLIKKTEYGQPVKKNFFSK